MKIYWYKYCPHCRAGQLEIWRDVGNDRLLMQCQECTWSWWNPEEISDPLKSFIGVIADIDVEPASIDQINKHGWTSYAQESYERDVPGKSGEPEGR
jgi:hypothetical protein